MIHLVVESRNKPGGQKQKQTGDHGRSPSHHFVIQNPTIERLMNYTSKKCKSQYKRTIFWSCDVMDATFGDASWHICWYTSKLWAVDNLGRSHPPQQLSWPTSSKCGLATSWHGIQQLYPPSQWPIVRVVPPTPHPTPPLLPTGLKGRMIHTDAQKWCFDSRD